MIRRLLGFKSIKASKTRRFKSSRTHRWADNWEDNDTHSAPLDSEQNNVFVYDRESKLFAIESWASPNPSAFDANSPQSAIIVLGGLTDGPLSLPYTKQLIATVNQDAGKHPVSVIQPLLSSSFMGYGASSIDQDIKQLDLLIDHLINSCHKQKLVLLGHSTGAQIVIRYLSSDAGHAKHPAIVAGVLQGAVSDREYMQSAHPATLHKYNPIALAMAAEGKGGEFMPREVDAAPMTASRFLSLYGKYTLDDVFSSDLRPEYLTEIYSWIEIPLLVCLSECDEYVPKAVTTDVLMDTAFAHIKKGTVAVIPEANHNLGNSRAARDKFCELLMEFLGKHGCI